MAKYLVSGGAGFIGSHIAETLVNRGQEVRILDNFSTGKKENLESFLDRIELIEEDIRDINSCKLAVKGIGFVLHQAALTSVPESVEDPLSTNDINITGTLNLLIAARDAGVKRFVFASSSAVYGDDPEPQKSETMRGRILSPYALSKLIGEKYCQLFSDIYGLSTVCLRYFNIFGPRQDPHSQYAAVIPAFINKMIKGERPTIFGDGDQSRDFTYVTNVVEGNIMAVEADNVSGEAINLACGDRITVNFLFEKICLNLKKDIKPIYEKPRQGDIRHGFADILKAKKKLKYEPIISFDEGLVNTIRWYKDRDWK